MIPPPAVYQKFLEFCQAYCLAEPWHGLAVAADCWAGPVQSTAALARLADEFLEAELLAAGLARSLPDGLVMNPAVSGEASAVIALRPAPDQPPFALLTSHGVLREQPLVPLAVLQDSQTLALLAGAGPQLLIGFDMADVMILRSLGLPATTPGEFAHLTAGKFRQIVSACGWLEDNSAGHAIGNAALPPAANGRGARQAVVDNGGDNECASDTRNSAAETPQAASGAATWALPPLDRGQPARPATVAGGESPPVHLPPGNDAHHNAAARTTCGDPVAVPPGQPRDPSGPTGAAALPVSPVSPALSGSPGLSSAAAPPPLTWVLVGWSLASLSHDQAPDLQALAEWLRDAARYLIVHTLRIALWLPTAVERARIEFCLAAESVSDARRAVTDSLAASLFTLDVLDRTPQESAGETYGYLEALRRYEACIRTGTAAIDPGALTDLQDTIYLAIEQELVEPLIEHAQEQADPLRRNLGMVAAGLAREFHRQAIPAAELGSGTGPFGTLSPEDHGRITILQKLASSLVRVSRGMRR